MELGSKATYSALSFRYCVNDLAAFACTIYDMCKAVDRGMVIDNVRVLEKHGGKSGHYVAP